MLLSYDTILTRLSSSPLDRDKARIYRAICEKDDATSRKRLAKKLSIRPTTISTLVNELIKDGVVCEVRSLPASGQGRPEVLLAPVENRLLVIMLRVVSRSIHCTLVNMTGEVLGEETVDVNRDKADNDMIEAAVLSLISNLMATAPEGAEVLGVGIVVPGIIDHANNRWIYAARWPYMHSLPFERVSREFGVPVRVSRNLNLELGTRLLRKEEERQGGILFIQWGFGIGSSYAMNGKVLETSIGSFGEFGHWTMNPASETPCHCGDSGCLETIASLWALHPRLQEEYPDVPADEAAFEIFAQDHDISRLPAVEMAVDTFALALANLNKVVFADRIVLSGPFVKIPAIRERLETEFLRHLPGYARGKCKLYVATRGAFDLTQGCVTPFFDAKMEEIFASHN